MQNRAEIFYIALIAVNSFLFTTLAIRSARTPPIIASDATVNKDLEGREGRAYVMNCPMLVINARAQFLHHANAAYKMMAIE